MTPAATLQEEMWRRGQARREAAMQHSIEIEPRLVALVMSLARLAAYMDVQQRNIEGVRDV